MNLTYKAETDSETLRMSLLRVSEGRMDGKDS